MKNNEILLDVIGEVDEKLLPELSEKKKKHKAPKWAAIGGLCAAAAIPLALLLPKAWNRSPFSTVGSKDMVLALASLPVIPAYPTNDDEEAYKAWSAAKRALRDQPKGYSDGFDIFFENSARTFLADANKENVVYSPLSLYMALGMTAEISGGNTQAQILDALAQDDISSLRSHAKSIWEANYNDDGVSKCVLATSLWTTNDFAYNMDTVNHVAENYYSSLFTGDPGNPEYSKLLQDWLNEQTGDLLTDYTADINMDPAMLITLASTVNYEGKWATQFNKQATNPDTFHAASGDETCDFMNAIQSTSYVRGDKFSSISLDLEENGCMRLILPDEGFSPEDLIRDEAVLNYLSSAADSSQTQNVLAEIHIPKFDVSSGIDLSEGLKEMGISDVFNADKADLSPLVGKDTAISLSKAEQDSRVKIDEEGCKAASLTVLELCGAAAPKDSVEFKLDRPFIFEIMSESGLPLFVGIVNTVA